MTRRSLVLFTTNHPYTYTGGETMFVAPELPHLVRAFDAVRIVPLHARGERLPLPEAALLDDTLATRWQRWAWLHHLGALCWPGFWDELRRGWRQGRGVGALRVWRWTAIAHACWAWMRSTLPADQAQLFYSYWRGGQTLAGVRWVAAHPASAVVTRVHRYELYEHAFDPPFQPWTSMYAALQRVIPISRDGADYLSRRGVDPARLWLARLGVPAAAARNKSSEDGVLRIVSCSSVGPPKQVPRIAEALCAFAAQHGHRRCAWTHFGDGPDLPSLRASLLTAPTNLTVNLVGQVSNAAVRAHYASEPVDLFVLLSLSEGLPVAIQEALAAGIPVLASDVGGVSEAVDDNAGLLAADTPVDAIVAALEGLLVDATPEQQAARRDAAWQRWARDFDADRNHAALAEVLAELASEAKGR